VRLESAREDCAEGVDEVGKIEREMGIHLGMVDCRVEREGIG
jgi:hypothetical protein